MKPFNCQPCKYQNKDINANFWCMFCEEALCEPCHNYHKVLKVTKNHRTVTCEDYLMFSDFLSELSTKCKNHPERELEYACPGHGAVICFLCKRNEHKDCKNVELIEEKSSTTDLYSKLETFSEKQEKRIAVMDAVCSNRKTNIESLDSQHEQFLKELKDKRTEINLALDTLEAELKSKFEFGYEKEKRKIEDILKIHTKTRDKWRKEYEQLSKIIELKPLSMVQLFLTDKQIREQNAPKGAKINDIVENLCEGSCTCRIALTISESNRSIKIEEELKISSKPQKIDMAIYKSNATIDSDANITDSSAYEYEASIEKVHSNDTTAKVCEKTTSRDKTDHDLDQKTQYNVAGNNHDQKAPLDNTKQDREKKLTSLSDKTCVPVSKNTENSSTTKKFNFSHINHFMILRRVSEIKIKCMKCLPNGNIIFGEVSQKRLHIYEKSGSKRGEISLNGVPNGITVFDDNCVVVTVDKSIVFVNFKTFSVLKTIKKDDICHGLAKAGKDIVLNCLSKGLYILDSSGVVNTHFSSLVGVMALTTIDPHTVVYARKGSELVSFLNIKTNNLTQSKCPNLSGPTSITADPNKNLYISCDKTDKIFLLQYGSEKWEAILTNNDGMDRPQSIDFNNYTLFIINNREITDYVQGNYKIHPSLDQFGRKH